MWLDSEEEMLGDGVQLSEREIEVLESFPLIGQMCSHDGCTFFVDVRFCLCLPYSQRIRKKDETA